MLKQALRTAQDLEIDTREDFVKAASILHVLQREKELMRGLDDALKVGGWLKEGDTVDLTRVEASIKSLEGVDLQFKYHEIMIEKAKVILRLRKEMSAGSVEKISVENVRELALDCRIS